MAEIIVAVITIAETAVAETAVAETPQLGNAPCFFWRTEFPLFWLLIRFQAVSGQEIRYCPHYPIKGAFGSALAAPESANCPITSDSVEIAAAVSAKSIIVQGVSRG
ncbi:hypothetical protein ASF12_14050 [Paenibacillus sp. Leaf72]|nr:hypothetical protein ASF12_14050 [Paenibacillus sp. Leaf72]